MITTFIHSEAGSIIISIIWGFALAILFRKVCVDRSCIQIYGPPPEVVNGKQVRWKGKCYEIQSKEASCDDPNVRVIPIR